MAQHNSGCLGFLFRLFAGDVEKVPALPYRVRDNFLTKAERSFYGVLRVAVRDQMVICPKVRLGDIFYVATRENAQSYRNKIDRKHVDFLLCDPQTLRPVLGVELDDASHQRAKTQARDVLVEAVFESAGLPIIRMPARASYSVEEVAGLLREGLALGTGAHQVATGTHPAMAGKGVRQSGAPVCPKCGVPMVERKSRKDGTRFWGCTNYPQCRQTASMD